MKHFNMTQLHKQ